MICPWIIPETTLCLMVVRHIQTPPSKQSHSTHPFPSLSFNPAFPLRHQLQQVDLAELHFGQLPQIPFPRPRQRPLEGPGEVGCFGANTKRWKTHGKNYEMSEISFWVSNFEIWISIHVKLSPIKSCEASPSSPKSRSLTEKTSTPPSFQKSKTMGTSLSWS